MIAISASSGEFTTVKPCALATGSPTNSCVRSADDRQSSMDHYAGHVLDRHLTDEVRPAHFGRLPPVLVLIELAVPIQVFKLQTIDTKQRRGPMSNNRL